MLKFVPIIITAFAFALNFYAKKRVDKKLEDRKNQLTPDLAKQVLGIEGSLSEDKIEKAYKKLIKKVHPDSQGSDFLAKQVNQARIILLNKIKK